MKLAFSIFKNDYKEKENQPDYVINYYNKETGESKKVGACWLKETKTGDKFFSCQYDDEYTPEKKNTADKKFDEISEDNTPF